jgi:hypothetical protein
MDTWYESLKKAKPKIKYKYSSIYVYVTYLPNLPT